MIEGYFLIWFKLIVWVEECVLIIFWIVYYCLVCFMIGVVVDLWGCYWVYVFLIVWLFGWWEILFLGCYVWWRWLLVVFFVRCVLVFFVVLCGFGYWCLWMVCLLVVCLVCLLVFVLCWCVVVCCWIIWLDSVWLFWLVWWVLDNYVWFFCVLFCGCCVFWDWRLCFWGWCVMEIGWRIGKLCCGWVLVFWLDGC